MERKIGDILEHEGKKYKCTKLPNSIVGCPCDECDLSAIICTDQNLLSGYADSITGYCNGENRTDKISTFFKLVSEEKPAIEESKPTIDYTKKHDQLKARYDLIPDVYYQLLKQTREETGLINDWNLVLQQIFKENKIYLVNYVDICVKWLAGEVNATHQLALVYTHGAEKYSPNSWQTVEKWRYENALQRHVRAFLNGEYIDADSGLPHMAHILWNVVALKWFEEKEAGK